MPAMQRRLDAAWAQRSRDTPLQSADQALILASIVEKETGPKDDPGLVAGVFLNRLRIGMPLQTDPTVIYGLGEAFDGNLRKRDLLADGALQQLHPRRPAAHADRDAGHGARCRRWSSPTPTQGAVLRVARRRQQRLQRQPGRP